MARKIRAILAFLLLYTAALLVCCVGKAHAQDTNSTDTPDLHRCDTIAGHYIADKWTMTPGELDDLRLCIVFQMAVQVQDQQRADHDRAIERNFGGGK